VGVAEAVDAEARDVFDFVDGGGEVVGDVVGVEVVADRVGEDQSAVGPVLACSVTHVVESGELISEAFDGCRVDADGASGLVGFGRAEVRSAVGCGDGLDHS